ncbi:MAG: substrate-binding domain-containing protein, partial [Bacteroidales bacterium]
MKTMTKSKSIAISLLTLLIIGLILCCGQGQRDTKTGRSEDTLKGNISISGAFALYPMTVKWAEEFQKLHPNVQIDISAGGAGKGMTDVLSNMVDLAMFSREVSKQEEEKGAWKIAVAKDAVFPTINQENPAKVQILKKGLTKEQFRKLFTNEDQPRWDQFEGFDIPVMINVYTRSDACGAAAMWAGYFGKEQEDLRGIGVFGDPGMADAVKKDKNGVGYNNLIYIYDMKTNKA